MFERVLDVVRHHTDLVARRTINAVVRNPMIHEVSTPVGNNVRDAVSQAVNEEQR